MNETTNPLGPDCVERLARARADLRIGLPVTITGDPGGPALVAAVETLTEDRMQGLRAATQTPFIAITRRRAEILKARPYSATTARIALPPSANRRWIQSLADPAADLSSPMKGPFTTLRDGYEGLATAATALARSARLLPSAFVAPTPEATRIARDASLVAVSTDEIVEHLDDLAAFEAIVGGNLPLPVSSKSRLHVFRPKAGGEEHYALEIGTPDRDQPVLARLHSACFTGDVLGSLKCDCGPQLQAALAEIGLRGEGVLLYLNQEGRGIGLANKMRAYALQDQGFDTVEANHRLGFEDDERDFRIGAELLRRLGFRSVRLMTNNPAKIARLESCGLSVTERVALRVGEGPLNRAYLATKALKSGHLL